MIRSTRREKRDAGRPRLVGFWLGALPVIGIALFAGGLAFGVRGDDVPILGLGILTGLLSFVPVILDQARPTQQRHLLLSLFSLAWFMFFSLPVFTQYFGTEATEVTRLRALINLAPADIVRGQIAALVTLLVVFSAYVLPLGPMAAQALPTPARDWSHQATLGVASVMIPLGWIIYLGSEFGLIPDWFGSGALGTVASATYYGIALLTLAYIRYRSRPALVLICVLIPPSMAFNFFTGSKTLFFLPAIMVVLAFLVSNRRIRIHWILAGVVAISLFYPVAQFYRSVVQEGNTLSAAQVLRNPGKALGAITEFASSQKFSDYFSSGLRATGARTSALNMTTVIMRDTPDRVPYQGGWSIGYAFLAYVPRIIWPDKPTISIGAWVTENYVARGPGEIRSATGPSWIGELYFNFGYLGIVLGMLFAGAYLRFLHEWLFRPRATIPALFMGIVVLWSVCPRLGGGIVALFNFLPFYGSPILAAHLLVRSAGTSASRSLQTKPADTLTANSRAGA